MEREATEPYSFLGQLVDECCGFLSIPPNQSSGLKDSENANTTESASYYFVNGVMAGLSARDSPARQAMMTVRKHFHSTGAGVFIYNRYSKPETNNCYTNFRVQTNKGQEKQWAGYPTTSQTMGPHKATTGHGPMPLHHTEVPEPLSHKLSL